MLTNEKIIKSVVFTICFVAALALVFFVSDSISSPLSAVVVAQAQGVAAASFDEPTKPVEVILKDQGNNPCSGFLTPIKSAPLTDGQSKMIVNPDEKIDYKLIIIDPCSPKPFKNKRFKQQKTTALTNFKYSKKIR